jgi:phosphoglycolate phosphatase-like HAD superfamily hydrolase
VIKLKDIFFENTVKKLRIFDFDDTLVKSNSRVKLIDKNGKEKWLTPGEYAIYQKQPGDEFDYSEFKQVIEPKEIKALTKVLRNFYHAGGDRRITILTARGVTEPIQDFLKTIGIQNVEIVAVDSSDPQKKSDWIEDKISQGYNDIFFIDDSPKNVAVVQKLKSQYPDVKWEIRLAKYS